MDAQAGTSHRVFLPAAIFLFVLLLFPSFTFPGQRPQQPPPSSASVPELKFRAEAGDSMAAFQLAHLLLEADPSSPGFDLALDWLRSFASPDHFHAKFLLGYLYEQGRGLPRDYAKAADNYQAAALRGYDLAQNNLGSLYLYGLGVPRDLHKAFELLLAAAQQGNPIPQCNLATLFLNGTGTRRDLTQAIKWLRVAADHGYAPAQHKLAVFYFNGVGVSVDYSEAARLEALAAQHGEARAQTDLAYLYETGKGVPLDYVAAYAWYSRSIAAGEKSGVERRTSLSHIMTSKQLEQAVALAATPLSPTRTASSNSGISAIPVD
jgi:TPR repeat protein